MSPVRNLLKSTNVMLRLSLFPKFLAGYSCRSKEQLLSYYNNHLWQAPWWSIAAYTLRCHCSRSWTHLHAVYRPMLSALRSFSTVHVHDCLGRLGGRLQWLGNAEITARSALEWSIRASDLATCPKSRRRRQSHRTVESCVWLQFAFALRC